MTNYVKEAEQKVVNIAKEMSDTFEVFDALARFGNSACHEYVGKKEFFEGLQTMRNALYKEYTKALADCFLFVGVGGEKAAEYSREKFKEHFEEDRYAVMNFLDKWGQFPSSWQSKEEEEFRKQAKELIK